jgi:hypothetical protein
VALLKVGDNRPQGATDFNDFVRYRGLEAVRACIANAKAPAIDELQPRSDKASADAREGKDHKQSAFK